MLKTLKFLCKLKAINSEKLALSYTTRDAADRLNGYSDFTDLNIFNVQIYGSPHPTSILGYVAPKLCDYFFGQDAQRQGDWIVFLNFVALSRIGFELSRSLGTSSDSDTVVQAVESALYDEIEQSWRSRFGC